MNQPQKKTAAPRPIGNGGPTKTFTPIPYLSQTDAATDFAARYVARRHRLPMSLARLVCELAQIGSADHA